VDEAGGLALRRWAQDMTAANRSGRTITERVRLVTRCAQTVGESPLTLSDEQVAEFLAGCKPKSRPTYFNHLHAWFTWLARQSLRDDVPTLRLDRPKVGRREPRTISTAHVRALVASPIWDRTRAMVFLGAYQGLRASEIAHVIGTDFDLIAGEMTVTGKGNVTRTLPLHPHVAELVPQFSRGWWFPSYTRPGRPIHAATVSNTISDAMERAGFNGTCHDLRRWYATTMIEAGKDLTTVQRLLGHASVATTQRYIAVGKELRLDAVLSLPDIKAA
jgi:site-specific recombinase XerD